ncbi:uncharacterized protein FYN16_000468 [Cariama cristata]
MRSGREQHGGQPRRGSPRRRRRRRRLRGAEATREAGEPPSADVGLSPARRLPDSRGTGTFKPDAAPGSRAATGEPARGSPREPVTSELIKGHAEDAVVCSCPEEALNGACLGLARLVSAWPGSPCGAGAKKDRRSSGWLWTGATVTEARERPSDRSLGRGTEERRRKKRLHWQVLPAAPRVTAAASLPVVSAKQARCGGAAARGLWLSRWMGVALLGPGDAQWIAPARPRFGCRPLRMAALRGRACVWRLLALCARLQNNF